MAREFDDASSQYLTVGLSLTEPFSMACWVWLDDANDHTFVSLGNSGDGYYHAIFLYSSSLWAYTRASDAAWGAEDNTPPGPGGWFHAVGVWVSSSSRILYTNGTEKNTDASTCTIASPDRFRLGVTADNTPYGYHDGKLAEVAIWNAALIDAEAAVLGRGFSPLFVRPQNLVAYYPLIRDTDNDLVGDYDLTPVGGPTVAAHAPVFYPVGPFAPVPSAIMAILGERGILRGVGRGIGRGL